MHDLVYGYAATMSLVDGVRIFETDEYNFAKGVPLEKNPRRWQYDPEFARRYAQAIKESNPPPYVYQNESLKGDTFKIWQEQQIRLREGGEK